VAPPSLWPDAVLWRDMAVNSMAAYPVSEEKMPKGESASAPATAKEAASDAQAKPAMLEAAQWAAPSTFRMLEDFIIQDDLLNLAPMFWFATPIFLLFLSLAAFLEFYVVTAAAHAGIFFIGSYMVFSAYFVANHYMMKLSGSYAAIPEDKKFYVLGNLIKSAVLLAYSPLAAKTLWLAMVDGEWSTPRIRNLGVLYAIPDAVSMLLVQRMAWSTKVHHLCVVVFAFVNLFVSYEEETVGRALVVYAVFSTFAYLVNLLLASRFLPVKPKLSLVMSVVALVTYAMCLAVNWLWQVQFLWHLAYEKPTIGLAVYLCLISLVVMDDCILMKWLWKNVGRTMAMQGTIKKVL